MFYCKKGNIHNSKVSPRVKSSPRPKHLLTRMVARTVPLRRKEITVIKYINIKYTPPPVSPLGAVNTR